MSNIEWTDTTWNPVVGCTPVSPGCLNCYAATMALRLEAMGKKDYAPRQDVAHTGELLEASEGNGKPIWERIAEAAENSRTIRIAEVRNGRAVFTGDVRTVPDRLTDPIHWRKPRRVFVNSMSDLFHEAVPWSFIREVFEVIRDTPRHTYQILTKRPERMAMMERETGLPWPPHAWAGASAENQDQLDERVPHLLRCPAAVRFLSCEPLLGPVDVFGVIRDMKARDVEPDPGGDGRYLHWIIFGGESGPNARPCDVAWIRSPVKQCAAFGVPCFVKQLGAWPVETNHGPEMPMRWRPDDGGEAVERWYRPADRKGADPSEWPEDLRVRQFPEVRQ